MGESWSTIMYKVVHEDPIALNVLNRTVPAGVNAAVMRRSARIRPSVSRRARPLPPRFDRLWQAGASSAVIARTLPSRRLSSSTGGPPQALARSLSRGPAPLGPLGCPVP